MAEITAEKETTGAGAAAEVFFTLPDICKRYGVAISTGYVYLRNGQLPKPIKIGPKLNRWPLSELEAWEKARLAERG